jgi:hypothetical protein
MSSSCSARTRIVRRLATAAVIAGTAATILPGTAAAAGSIVPHAHVDLPAAIEQFAPYQPQTFCDPVAKPGTLALAHLLTSTYTGTAIVSLTRPCASDTSEHYDGRAIDWGVDHRNDHLRAQGKAFLDWLFASDASGDKDAMVRRLGIMYVIWNHRIWGAYSQRWEPYTNCSGPTACHVDHMHISLDWSGALEKTSFWTGTVTAPLPPPLRTLRVGGTATTTVSPRQAPTPAYRLVKGGRYTFTVTGTYNYDGQPHHRADAECSTTDGKHWLKQAAFEDTGTIGLLDLWVNSMHTWHASTKSGCSTTHHRYTATMTTNKRVPLAYAIHDTVQWGADGQLTVTVHRVS